MKLDELLSEYFCRVNEIDLNQNYTIEKIKAKDLIVSERLDLIPKLKYIEFREKGYDLTFPKEIYTAHIEALTLGTYNEPGNVYKNSIKKYFDTFDFLIDDIKKNGFDEHKSVIPVGGNNAILDGAHRVAVAAYFNLEVPIIRFNNIYSSYNVDFFKERLLNEEYLDYIVLEYSKLKKEIYCACVWPRAKGKSQLINVDKLVRDSGKIVYKKKIGLNYNGLYHLIKQVYSSEAWVGDINNHYKGAKAKSNQCYDNSEIITVYIFECESYDKVVTLKKKIRDIFNVGKHSIHITDNTEQTVRIANMLLNENSIHFLNNGNPNKYVEFINKLDEFMGLLTKHDLNSNQFIIDSSSVLALYGLRDAEDIDFITSSDQFEMIENKFTHNHHDYLKYYEMPVEELLLNPKTYFYYNDLKFTSLGVLKTFKRNRAESKDETDIELIDSITTEKNEMSSVKNKFKKYLKRSIRNSKYALHDFVVKVSKKLFLYKYLKRYYKYLKSLN
ncbi:hypothetical protein ACO1PF_10395 [Alkalibacterium sp. f15]|uniref:hypothetical protein n=1 Tax=Alkalibacterium sp. f15 TaxID=3414029 RepID=UPI003BF80DD6